MKAKNKQFKNSWRKEQIQLQFQSKRNLLTFIGGDLCYQTCYQTIGETIQKILSNIKLGHLLQASNGLKIMIKLIVEKSEASTFVFMHSQNLAEIIELVSNYKMEEQKSMQFLHPPQLINQITESILEFLEKITYNILDHKSFARVFQPFWIMLENNKISLYEERARMIVNRMMNPSNQIVYSCLKKHKMSAKIAQIIKLQHIFEIDFKMKCQILDMISFLLQNERSFDDPDSNCKQNKLFLQFCLRQMKKNYSQQLKGQLQESILQAFVQNVLSTMRNILDFDAELVKRIKNQDLAILCQLVSSKVRKVKVNAVQILNVIIFQESSFNGFLINQLQILQLIEKQLREQLYFNDDQTNNLVQKYTCILCNITSVRDNKLKMKIFEQGVWELALKNINRFNNALINVFQFYFQIVPTRQLLGKVMCYLDALAQLDFKYLLENYKKGIAITIHRLYFRIEGQLQNLAIQKFIEKLYHEPQLQQFLNKEMKEIIDMREGLQC